MIFRFHKVNTFYLMKLMKNLLIKRQIYLLVNLMLQILSLKYPKVWMFWKTKVRSKIRADEKPRS